MSPTSKCILHIGRQVDSKEDLKNFDILSWRTVKNCDKLRRSQWPNSKFNTLTLPNVFDSNYCYHSSCYSDFTAVPKVLSEPSNGSRDCNNNDLAKPTLRSEVQHVTASSSGLFENVCVFCNQVRKKVKQKHENLTSIEKQSSADNIRFAAIALNDNVLLTKLSDFDLVAKQLKCHHSCRSAYLKRWERVRDTNKENQEPSFSSHKNAYECVRQYVQNKVINLSQPQKLSALFKMYSSLLDDQNPSYKPQNLSDKLINDFKGSIKKCKSSNKDGLVICSAFLSDDYAIRQADIENSLLKDAAIYLRNIILSDSRQEAGENSKTDQTATPPELLEFFRVLYTGTHDMGNSEQIERLIKSVSDDVVYATSRGRIKPDKHINVGLGVKSLTGSRRVIEILNIFGHSVCYHTVEEMETQLATDISEKKQATPDGLSKSPGLLTSLAWDNYDENIETLSGAGTLHDTVGICYQVVPSKEQLIQTINKPYGKRTSGEKSHVSRRSIDVTERTLEPYRKKPRMSDFHYENTSSNPPSNLKDVNDLDTFWMINTCVFEDFPMWSGWNALVTEDKLPLQKVGYMENISLPPTRLDVVAETLRQSQKVAQECGEAFVIVTYDLAVAKPALQIQAQEAPLYDNVFICFGAFHILMAYFGAIGYLLDGSGGPDILTNSGVLASGSLNAFIKGKHFNRCKRLHITLANAFHTLHFRKFLEVRRTLPSTLEESMRNLSDDPTPQKLRNIQQSRDYQQLIDEYMQYSEETIHGNHGNTAKFWLNYVYLVQTFLRFTRASRTNDLELFTYTFGEMCSIFFSTGRPNYSRWMVKYQLNLLNADPAVKDRLSKGALSIRRTKKDFSRTEVDLTLEQTINADAASRLTGITAFTNSDSARKRWMITRAVRSDIVGRLMEKAGLKSEEDITKSLKPYRIKKDRNDLKNVIGSIESTMNPFTQEPDDNLYCIATGKQASECVKADLLSCLEKGSAWKEEFTSKCLENPLNFEKPIKRRKVNNFCTDAIKTEVTSKDKKVLELQSTRDVFGRLLCISTEGNLDLSKVFSYPLLAVPLSLAHIDGSINKTDKSKFMKKLEQYCIGPQPDKVDVTFVDAMFLLHSLTSTPKSFGDLSSTLLSILCMMSSRVDFICDMYVSPSIKYIERERRGESETSYCISGPDQKVPRNWQNALKNSSFKKALFRFLTDDWKNSRHSQVLMNHTVLLAVEEKCHKFSVQTGQVAHDILQEYTCEHEEADTRLIFHLSKAVQDNPDNEYVIRSSDTDVLVLLLYHASQLPEETKVWMDAGLSSRNTRRFIPVHGLNDTQASEWVDTLPGIHALTGNDFCSSFINKGKIRPFEIMKKSQMFTRAFAELGNEFPLTTSIATAIEQFVCCLYGFPTATDIDLVRYSMFKRIYASDNGTGLASRLKSLDPGSMPPCKKVLQKKIERANYVSSVWKNANMAFPVKGKAEENGWILSGNCYQIEWFEGDQLPNDVVDLVLSSPSIQDQSEEDDDNVNIVCDDLDTDDDDEYDHQIEETTSD